MPYRKIGDTFTHNKTKYLVCIGEYDRNKLVHCDPRCAFYSNQLECRRNIKTTGDCQPRYRGDNTPVYFKRIK